MRFDVPLETVDREYPQDDPFQTPDDGAQTLRYKEEVVQNLVTQIHEYLMFGTTRELFKLIAEEL